MFSIKFLPFEVVARYRCTTMTRQYASTEIVDWQPFDIVLNDFWNAIKKCKQENDAAGKETNAVFELSPHGVSTDWRHALRKQIRVDAFVPEEDLKKKFTASWENLSKQAYQQRNSHFFESTFENIPPQ